MSDIFQHSSLLSSIVPESLLDVERTISTIRATSFEKRNAVSEVIRNCEMGFDNLEQKCSDYIKEQERNFQKLSKEKEHTEKQLQSLHKEQMELEEKIKRNKSRCEEKIINHVEEAELAEMMKKVCTLKEEIEKKKRNILLDYSEFKKGIHVYNKYLQCNVLLEEQNVVIFTPNLTAKTVSDVRDYIKFITPDDGITFQFVEMQPKLRNETSLVKRFQETEDIQGFILAFLKALRLFTGRKYK